MGIIRTDLIRRRVEHSRSSRFALVFVPKCEMQCNPGTAEHQRGTKEHACTESLNESVNVVHGGILTV